MRKVESREQRSPKRTASLCVIAVEGAKREPGYFEQFKESKINCIEILPADKENLSAPQQVLERLQKETKEQDYGEEDSLWLVFDTDHHAVSEIEEIRAEAKQAGFRVAVSNPCFEFWLFLHKCKWEKLPTTVCQQPQDQRAKMMKEALHKINYQYPKSFGEFFREVNHAIQQAQQTKPLASACPSTEMHLVAQDILNRITVEQKSTKPTSKERATPYPTMER